MKWTAGCLLPGNPGPAIGSGGSGFSDGVELCGEAECKQWELQKPLQLFEQVEKRVVHFQPRETQNSEMEFKKADRIRLKGAVAIKPAFCSQVWSLVKAQHGNHMLLECDALEDGRVRES